MSLAQFYTISNVSDDLVSQFQVRDPATILDIGCGELSLLLAAERRWNKANLIGYDIDPDNIKNGLGSNFSLSLGDGLDPDLSKKIKDSYGEIDVAISNPPYLSVDRNERVIQVLRESNLLGILSNSIQKIPYELIFMAQNVLVMKKGAELGIILPSGMISGERWKVLREFILSEFSVESCIELPNDSFKNTEVSAFALCLKKEKSKKNTVALRSLTDSEIINISHADAANRMDFSYYKKSHSFKKDSFKEYEVDSIFRGNVTHADLKARGLDYLHSTSIRSSLELIGLPDYTVPSSVRSARSGDIVIVRVGTRCVGKAAFIKSGLIPISDCLIVIRSEYNQDIWRLMEKSNFQEIIRNQSLGTGAKYLTIQILKDIFNVK